MHGKITLSMRVKNKNHRVTAGRIKAGRQCNAIILRCIFPAFYGLDHHKGVSEIPGYVIAGWLAPACKQE